MLTQRQIETLVHLKKRGLSTPQEVINWCNEKLKLSYVRKHKPFTGRRKHAKEYYQQIIAFFENDPSR